MVSIISIGTEARLGIRLTIEGPGRQCPSAISIRCRGCGLQGWKSRQRFPAPSIPLKIRHSGTVEDAAQRGSDKFGFEINECHFNQNSIFLSDP